MADGLKIRCPQGRVGSTPSSGTKWLHVASIPLNNQARTWA